LKHHLRKEHREETQKTACETPNNKGDFGVVPCYTFHVDFLSPGSSREVLRRACSSRSGVFLFRDLRHAILIEQHVNGSFERVGDLLPLRLRRPVKSIRDLIAQSSVPAEPFVKGVNGHVHFSEALLDDGYHRSTPF